MIQALRPTRESGVTLLLEGAAVALVLGALAALLGWIVSGPAAGLGVVVGTCLVVLVCTAGGLVVHAVTRVAPAASLLVALLTYTLQLLVLLVVFVGLEGAGLLGSELDRTWLGGAVVGATLLWVMTQVAQALRARVPAYDLGPEVGDR